MCLFHRIVNDPTNESLIKWSEAGDSFHSTRPLARSCHFHSHSHRLIAQSSTRRGLLANYLGNGSSTRTSPLSFVSSISMDSARYLPCNRVCCAWTMRTKPSNSHTLTFTVVSPTSSRLSSVNETLLPPHQPKKAPFSMRRFRKIIKVKVKPSTSIPSLKA